MNGRERWIKIAVVVALVAAIVLVWRAGLVDYLTRERMRGWASWAGWWGPFAFVGLFAIGEVLHVPSVIFVVVASMVWSLPIALVTAYTGAMAASAVVFVVARYLVSGALQDAIRKRMPAEVKRYDDALETRGVRTVALIRLLTFMSPVMHWVLATSRVRFGDMMAGTAIGVLPGIVALVIVGEAAVSHWDAAQPWVLGAVVVLVAVRVVTQRRKKRRAETV